MGKLVRYRCRLKVNRMQARYLIGHIKKTQAIYNDAMKHIIRSQKPMYSNAELRGILKRVACEYLNCMEEKEITRFVQQLKQAQRQWVSEQQVKTWTIYRCLISSWHLTWRQMSLREWIQGYYGHYTKEEFQYAELYVIKHQIYLDIVVKK